MLYAPRATLSAKPPVWCVIVPRSASSSESLIRSPVLRAQLVLLRPPASPSVTGGAPAIASYAFLALAHAQYAQGYGRAPLPREHALPAARMHACRRQRARASPPRSRRTRPRCISAAQRVLAFTAAKPAPAAAPDCVAGRSCYVATLHLTAFCCFCALLLSVYAVWRDERKRGRWRRI